MLRKVGKIITGAQISKAVTDLELRNRQLSREIARESIVLLKNDGTLPLSRGTSLFLYGKGSVNTLTEGSGSGEVNPRYTVSIRKGLEGAGIVLENSRMLDEYERACFAKRRQYEKKMDKKAGLFKFSVLGLPNADISFREREFFTLGETNCPADSPVGTCIYVIGRESGEGADRRLENGDYFLTDTEINNLKWCCRHHSHVILLLNTGGPVDLSPLDDMPLSAIVYAPLPGEEAGNAIADILLGRFSPSGHLASTWPMRYEDVPFPACVHKTAENVSIHNQQSVFAHHRNVEAGSRAGSSAPPRNDKNTCRYGEGIFCGYRYYDKFDVKTRYRFGYGLSYTTFSTKARIKADVEERFLRADILIKNTGEVPGKYTAQLYVTPPGGAVPLQCKSYRSLKENESTASYKTVLNIAVPREKASLIGFAKTSELLPGGEERLTINVPFEYMTYFDEGSCAWVMEEGLYTVCLGNASCSGNTSADFTAVGTFSLDSNVIIEKCRYICRRPGSSACVGSGRAGMAYDSDSLKVHGSSSASDKASGAVTKAKWSHAFRLADLLVGKGAVDSVIPFRHPVTVPGAVGYSRAAAFAGYSLPEAVFCDGTAGLRLAEVSAVRLHSSRIRYISAPMQQLRFVPKVLKIFGYEKDPQNLKHQYKLYTFATAFPCETALAQTWNPVLAQKMGRAVGAEMEKYGVTFWLAPGMNIQREPLCGRNFEYFSEDPILTGKMAAALTRGVQSRPGRYAVLKHFACNNREDNRKDVNVIISERALREIYLRGFKIAIKEGGARAVMTSYNRINSRQNAENKDLLEGFLRNECGFDGIVMTDWDLPRRGLNAYTEIESGVNLLMPGDVRQLISLRTALISGKIHLETVRKRVAQIIALTR